MTKSLKVFPSIRACNLAIILNKQRQPHNNLATIRRANLKGAYEHSKKLQFVNYIDNVVIEDYYHVTTMNANVTWMKLTRLLAIVSLNHRAPFCTFNFTSNLLITFLNVHIKEKIIPFPYVFDVHYCLK